MVGCNINWRMGSIVESGLKLERRGRRRRCGIGKGSVAFGIDDDVGVATL